MSRARVRRKKAERVAWWARKQADDMYLAERRAVGYEQFNVPAWSANGVDYDSRFYEKRGGLWYRKSDEECAKHGKVWKDQNIIGIMSRKRRS